MESGGAVIRLIIVGTDGSDTAGAAVSQAVALALGLGSRLQIVSAFEPPAEQRLGREGALVPDDLDWTVGPHAEVVELLKRAQQEARDAGVSDVETFARQGDAADAILDVAEEQGADLIVVGHKGMRGAERFLLGSVPNKVSHHAPCSVLIVRTS
jgi:nucleotide-binding universal stress UspA family protein